MVGDNIRKLRIINNITQKQLGDKIGISEQAINHYEANRRNPPIDILNKLSNYFGVSLDYLITGKGNCLTYEDLDSMPRVNMSEEEALQSILDIIESRDWDEDKKEHYRQDIKYAFKDNK